MQTIKTFLLINVNWEIMISVIYTTINNIQDARKIAHMIVEEQLVACVNIIPNVESIYRWKGKIEEENEYIIIAKTTEENIKKTIRRIEQIHPYEIPDIIVLSVTDGLQDYLDYVANEAT
jgi:periplasmic divalent cation tolerance protein